MRFLFFFLFLSLPTYLIAQSEYKECENADYSVNISTEMLQTYSGSICFTGTGNVPEDINLNNWSWLRFSADDTISVHKAIVFGGGGKVFANGNLRFSQITMNGGDTLYVNSGVCRIDNIVGENADADKRNIIVLNDGAELYIAGMPLNPSFSDVVISTGPQKSNKLKVIMGSSQRIGMRR